MAPDNLTDGVSFNLSDNNKTIKASLTDGYMFSTFDVGDRFNSYAAFLKENDRIAILGVVDKLSDYGFMGNSVALKDCYIFAYGDTAEKCDLGKTSNALSEYLKTTAEVAESNDISEDDYKSLCEPINHEDIMRNPDKNKGKYCYISGTVSQTIKGFLNSYTLYIEDSNGDKWGCVYTYKEKESQYLEGDYITVYGQCQGKVEVETILGEPISLPRIDVEYID